MQVEVGAVYINKFQFGVIRPPEQYAGLSGVGSIAAGPLFCPNYSLPPPPETGCGRCSPPARAKRKEQGQKASFAPVCALAPEANLRSDLLRGFYSGGATFLP